MPAIFRVREQPDPTAIEYLVSQLATLDVPTPPISKDMGPSEAGQAVGRISNRLSSTSTPAAATAGRRSPR